MKIAPMFLGLSLIVSASINPAFSAAFTTIDVRGAIGTIAWGINPAGDIVGSYTDASNDGHGFLLRHGTITSIDVPGSLLTTAFGINAQGDIVGTYVSGSRAHGFLLRHGTFTLIDVPG